MHLLSGADKVGVPSFDGRPIKIESTIFRRQRYEVRAGTNFVRVIQVPKMLDGANRRSTEYTLDIREGDDELLLPIDDAQC